MNKDKIFGKILIAALVSIFILPFIWAGYYHFVFSPNFFGGFWESQKLSVPIGQWDCIKEYLVSFPGLALEIAWAVAVLGIGSFLFYCLREPRTQKD